MAFFWLLTTVPFLYVLLRVIDPFRNFRWYKVPAVVLLFLAAFKFQILRLFAGPMFFAPDLPVWVLALSSWMLSSFLFFFALELAADLVQIVWLILRALFRAVDGSEMRRDAMVDLALLVAACVLASWGMCGAKAAPELRSAEVCRPDLPHELDRLKIVLLADLHVDRMSTREEVEDVVRRTNALEPDLIVLAGDFVDGRVDQLGYKLEPLKNLRAKYGVYGIPGNHEYYSGYREWMAFLRTLGIDMLENEHREPAGDLLVVAGVTDRAARMRKMEEPDVKKALAGAPEKSFKILLAHQPAHTREAAEAGADLQLSGHTHGGMIVGLDRVIAGLNYGYVSGMYDVGKMKLYVSRGTSLWKGFPIRLGVPSEITVVTLLRK